MSNASSLTPTNCPATSTCNYNIRELIIAYSQLEQTIFSVITSYSIHYTKLYDWVVLQYYNTKKKTWESAHSGAELLMLNQGFTRKWEDALMDCYTQYAKDPKAMQERIDALIDEYLDVFWTLEGNEPIQFAKDYCGIEEEDWRWPDVVETQKMKNAVKAELQQELKPVFEDSYNFV